MSRLQQEAKPFLLPLIKGDTDLVFRRHAQVLAAWVTMTAMVIDFADPETVSVADEDRKAFSRGQTALDNWRIFLGLVPAHEQTGWHGGNRKAFWHRGAEIITKRDNAIGIPRPPAQLTLIRLGRIVFAAASSSSNILTAKDVVVKPSSLEQLWPVRFGGVHLPSVEFTDSTANRLFRDFISPRSRPAKIAFITNM